MLFALPFFLAALFVPFPTAWVMIFITCCGLFFNTGGYASLLQVINAPPHMIGGRALVNPPWRGGR